MGNFTVSPTAISYRVGRIFVSQLIADRFATDGIRQREAETPYLCKSLLIMLPHIIKVFGYQHVCI